MRNLKVNEALSQEELKNRLHYDPITGQFTWLKSISNVRAGDIAGCVWTREDGLSYRVIRIGRLYLAHRLAFFYMTAEFPQMQIDHRDRNGLNNAWANLRLATPSQNQANTTVHKTNRIGLKGVRKAKQKCGYTARITRQGKCLNIGTFRTAEEAHAAYAATAEKYDKEFART